MNEKVKVESQAFLFWDSYNEGTYDVSLSVTSEFGCFNSIQNDITVYIGPNASFTTSFDKPLYT